MDRSKHFTLLSMGGRHRGFLWRRSPFNHHPPLCVTHTGWLSKTVAAAASQSLDSMIHDTHLSMLINLQTTNLPVTRLRWRLYIVQSHHQCPPPLHCISLQTGHEIAVTLLTNAAVLLLFGCNPSKRR